MGAKKKSRIRLIIQIGFFVLIALISINHSLAEKEVSFLPFLSSASLHAVCPFGGVVSAYQVITSGRFVRQVHESSFILMWIALLTALLFGPVFCGWICPLGSFQEWIGKIGRKITGKKYNTFVPQGIDSKLRYLRYAVLAWVIYMTAVTGVLVFADYDPYYALFKLWTGEVAVTGYIVLAAVIILSLAMERPFCKYACPFGAALGVFNLFRIFTIKRNGVTCIDCKACDRACPMNITVSTAGKIRNHQCITCMKCSSDQFCPVKDTVNLEINNPLSAGAVK